MSKDRLNNSGYVNPLITNFEDFKFIAGFFKSEVHVAVFGSLRSMLKNAKDILDVTEGDTDTYQKLLSELYEVQSNLESNLFQATKCWFNELDLIETNPDSVTEENYFEILFDTEAQKSIVCDITTSWLNVSFDSVRPVAVFSRYSSSLSDIGTFEDKVYHFVNDVMEGYAG